MAVVTMLPSLVALTLTFVLTATVVGAQMMPPLAPLLPTALASARPHGLELAAPGAGTRIWALSLAYGNAFSSASEVHRAHQTLDPSGAPLSDVAWDDAVTSRGDRSTWAVDLEVVRLDLEACRAVGRGMWLGARLPVWWSTGSDLDSWPSRWHRIIGVDDAGRELYPRRQSVFRLGEPGSQLDLSGETGPELGDVSVWATWLLPRVGRLEPRVWIAATAPTGGDLGTGGWAGGLRAAVALDLDSLSIDGGLGLTAVEDVPGPWSAANPLWHAWMSADLRLSDRWRAGLVARSDASPYHAGLSDRPASASAELSFGPSLRLGEGLWLQVALGEDFPGMGLAPDFSIQTRLVIRPARSGPVASPEEEHPE